MKREKLMQLAKSLYIRAVNTQPHWSFESIWFKKTFCSLEWSCTENLNIIHSSFLVSPFSGSLQIHTHSTDDKTDHEFL